MGARGASVRARAQGAVCSDPGTPAHSLAVVTVRYATQTQDFCKRRGGACSWQLTRESVATGRSWGRHALAVHACDPARPAEGCHPAEE